MPEREPYERRNSNIPDDVDTDDLETEVIRRRSVKNTKQQKLVIGGALAAALTAWIPNVASFIDAKTDKLKQEALATKVIQEKVSNESAYESLAEVINQHSDRLKGLAQCEADLNALKEWKKGVDEKLRQRLNVHVPVELKLTRVNSEDKEETPKVSPTRPQANRSDPEVQRLSQELLK